MTILIPPTVWMELKCKRANLSDSTRRRDEVVIHMPRAPYKTVYEPALYTFVPLAQPHPQWQVATNFIPGTYVMEAFDHEIGGASLFMWDIAGQEDYRPGEEIIADICTALR